MKTKLSGNIVDIINRRIFKGTIEIKGGKIINIIESEQAQGDNYILPGLVDAHIHIESSMLVPSEFARAAVVHGTVATVSDPHEIANVLGTRGIDFMVENSLSSPFKFYFGVPSCVPATNFESSGAKLNPRDIGELFVKYNLKYLSEMMNFPGVIYGDEDVKAKLEIARKLGKVIDGHAPGVKGDDLKKYAAAGISTDHECFTLDEALEKISLGMNILIREGSAAKNFDTLHSLISTHTDKVMLCSDDLHPDDLAAGHINLLVKRALAFGHDIFDILQTAILNPSRHYSLDVGLLRKGDAADLIVIDSLENFNILKTFIDGNLVSENGKPYINSTHVDKVNIFNAKRLIESDIEIEHRGGEIKVIVAIEGELITDWVAETPLVENGKIISDPKRDILKLVVVNRYSPAPPKVAFIHNIGLQKGALATSVAHDSHNIIAVGTSDEEIIKAINLLIDNKGGMAAVSGLKNEILALPIAGLMSDEPIEQVAVKYKQLNDFALRLGSKLATPFMTLSFMSLLVIPKLKLSDKGLFDGEKFCFTELEVTI